MGTKYIFGIFVTLALIYLGLTFGTPPDAASMTKYHLSNDEINLLRLTITLPVIAIWFIAFYGYSRFSKYAKTVKKSPEGPGWTDVVRGLLLLALWLPVSSVVSSLTMYLSHDNDNLLVLYLLIILIAAGFVVITLGTRKLHKLEEV